MPSLNENYIYFFKKLTAAFAISKALALQCTYKYNTQWAKKCNKSQLG